MDGADQAEFQHFQKYLNRIFEKYGPDVWADAYADLVSEAAQHATGTSRESCCSFCGKRKSEVADRMVNGPGVSASRLERIAKDHAKQQKIVFAFEKTDRSV